MQVLTPLHDHSIEDDLEMETFVEIYLQISNKSMADTHYNRSEYPDQIPCFFLDSAARELQVLNAGNPNLGAV
jgi:hypothetical protein